MLDARPFLSHHVRQRANNRAENNGPELHVLARWIENLPARDPRMERIERTGALDYQNGSFVGGEEAEALIDNYVEGDDDAGARSAWLERFADAVARHWK